MTIDPDLRFWIFILSLIVVFWLGMRPPR